MDKLNVARATAAQALELQRCAALTAELGAAGVFEAAGWATHRRLPGALARIDLLVTGIQGTGAPATWGKRTQGLKSYITVGNLYRLHSRSSKARRSPRRACE